MTPLVLRTEQRHAYVRRQLLLAERRRARRLREPRSLLDTRSLMETVSLPR